MKRVKVLSAVCVKLPNFTNAARSSVIWPALFLKHLLNSFTENQEQSNITSTVFPDIIKNKGGTFLFNVVVSQIKYDHFNDSVTKVGIISIKMQIQINKSIYLFE